MKKIAVISAKTRSRPGAVNTIVVGLRWRGNERDQ